MKDSSSMIIWAFAIGFPVFLLVEHPVAFWLVFVPIITMSVISFIMWLKK